MDILSNLDQTDAQNPKIKQENARVRGENKIESYYLNLLEKKKKLIKIYDEAIRAQNQILGKITLLEEILKELEEDKIDE